MKSANGTGKQDKRLKKLFIGKYQSFHDRNNQEVKTLIHTIQMNNNGVV